MDITATSCSLQSQIYNFFANCLQIFKNKVTLLMKISRDRSQNKTHQNQLVTLQEKSYELYQIFMTLQQDIIHKHQQVVLRFFSRVKEIIQHSKRLADDIKKLEQEIKQIDKNNLKIRQIVCYLLLKIPSSQNQQNVLHHQASQQSDFKRTLNNFNVGVLTQELTPKETKITKSTALKQSYEKCLQKLNKDLSLFDCLYLDEADYRRTFFLSLRNQTHQDDQLYEQISERNKYIKWIMQIYSNMFSKYIVKRQSPKKKGNKKEEGTLDKQNTKNKFIKQKEKKENDKSNLKKEKEDKYKLKHLKQRTNTIWYRENQKLANHKNNTEMLEAPPCQYQEEEDKVLRQEDRQSNIASLSSKYKTATQMNMSIQSKEQSHLNIVNVFPLKKIEFKDKKLELGPEKMLNSAQIKKRDLFQRTQDKFRNKMSNSKSRQTSKRVLEESIYSSANFLVNKKPNNRIKTQYTYNKSESSNCPFYTPLNIVYSESTTKYYPSKVTQKNPHRLIQQLKSHQNISNKVPSPQNQLNGKIFEITNVHSVDKYNMTGFKYKPINTGNSRKINSKRNESSSFNSKLLNITAPKNQY